MEYKIKNIKNSNWLMTLSYPPKSIDDIVLLTSIVDKIGIFKNYDLSKTNKMSGDQLNIFYIILRITNKIFNRYLDYIVKKIFIIGLKKIFNSIIIISCDLFFDQLTQDLYHFFNLMINKCYPKINKKHITIKFHNFLILLLEKPFYKEVVGQIGENNVNFIHDHKLIFNEMIDELIEYTKNNLDETYESMNFFCSKIFENNCSQETTNNITHALKNHININNLLDEECMEIDVYNEQKLDDIINNQNKNIFDINIINDCKLVESFENIGYVFYQNKNSEPSIFQPLLEHNFGKNEKDIVNILLYVMKNYRYEKNLFKFYNSTIENCYLMLMSAQNKKFKSYNQIYAQIKETGKIPETFPHDIIFNIISRLFNVSFMIYKKDFSVTEIDNTKNSRYKKHIVMYLTDNNKYITLIKTNSNFEPIYTSVPDRKIIFKNFGARKYSNPKMAINIL